ncbi:MAG: hypothetical protein ACOCWI_02685, partial [Bacillota bacterium]
TGEDTDPADTTEGAAGTFKSYVTSEDVLEAIADYSDGVYYDEVAEELKVLTHGTTTDGEAFSTPEGVREPGDIETNHYTFRLYFYSTNEYDVMLNTTDSSVTSVSGGAAPIEAWDDGLSFEYDTVADSALFDLGDAITAEAKDAARLSFNDGITTNIWDPNPDTGFTDNSETGNVAYLYYNNVANSSSQLTLGTPVANTVNDTEVLLTLEGSEAAGYYGYLDVSIWLEGWDANAFNSILSDVITTNLQFKGDVVID